MEAQRQYIEEQKYIEANRATLDKMLEQEQQAMAAQAPGSLFEAFGAVKKPELKEGELEQDVGVGAGAGSSLGQQPESSAQNDASKAV